jgi:hypothetical protein
VTRLGGRLTACPRYFFILIASNTELKIRQYFRQNKNTRRNGVCFTTKYILPGGRWGDRSPIKIIPPSKTEAPRLWYCITALVPGIRSRGDFLALDLRGVGGGLLHLGFGSDQSEGQDGPVSGSLLHLRVLDYPFPATPGFVNGIIPISQPRCNWGACCTKCRNLNRFYYDYIYCQIRFKCR